MYDSVCLDTIDTIYDSVSTQNVLTSTIFLE